MNSDLASGLAGVSLVVGVFLFVVAILWFLVPFAIFGIKPLLRQLIAQTSRTNALLEELQRERQGLGPVARIESVP